MERQRDPNGGIGVIWTTLPLLDHQSSLSRVTFNLTAFCFYLVSCDLITSKITDNASMSIHTRMFDL